MPLGGLMVDVGACFLLSGVIKCGAPHAKFADEPVAIRRCYDCPPTTATTTTSGVERICRTNLQRNLHNTN